MAITKLEIPVKMSADEVDREYHGRWVAFHQPKINESGLVYGYGEDKPETQDSDYNELKLFMYHELKLRPMLVHGCKDRGRMNLHVEFHTN